MRRRRLARRPIRRPEWLRVLGCALLALLTVTAARAQQPKPYVIEPPPEIPRGQPPETKVAPVSAREQGAEPQLPAPAPIPEVEVPELPRPRALASLLTLHEVLESVALYYPQLIAAEQERAIAAGLLLSAQGAFDLNLFTSEYGSLGTYDQRNFDVGAQQATPYGGTSFFGGYRRGLGDFPTYYLNRKTADSGELRAGMEVPLFRDRAIDERRAKLQSSRIGRELAEPNILGQRIDIGRSAAQTYWAWVAAGQRFSIAFDVLQLALKRDAQLAEQVKQGKIAPIDRVDNRRAIVARQAALVQAERLVQQVTIALSLFVRDAAARPVLVATSRMPGFPDLPPLPDERHYQIDVQNALAARPELQRLQLQVEQLQVDLRLAENQRLPRINLTVSGRQDVGPGKSSLSGPNGLDRNTYEAAVRFDLPLQRRDATGKADAARARLAQLGEQQRLMTDRIVAELRDAYSALERAHALAVQAKEGVELAERMAEAEREKYRLGQSNLLFVNMRELMAAEARDLLVTSHYQFFSAFINYQAALGIDLTSPAGR